MAHIDCLVCLDSAVSGSYRNALGRGSASHRHITKLDQSTFLWISMGMFNYMSVVFVLIIEYSVIILLLLLILKGSFA